MLPILEAGRQLWSFHWLIFTSANAVRTADEHWESLGGLRGLYQDTSAPINVRHSHPPKVICVGSSTQRALNELGLKASLVPKKFHAEGILELLGTHHVGGQRVLIPRALIAREILPEALRAKQAEVWVSPVYQTLGAPLLPQVKTQLLNVTSERTRYLVFTSDSTVHRLIEQMKPHELSILQKYARVVVIGPVVERAASVAGFDVCRVAQPHTIDGLIEILVTDYQELTSRVIQV